MGLNWHAVLVKATDEETAVIARRMQPFVSALRTPVDVSVIADKGIGQAAGLTSLRVVQFRNRPIECVNPPEELRQEVGKLGLASEDGGPSELSDPNILLAMVASRAVGRAVFVFYSDSVCGSGYADFRSGRLNEGLIYGWNGTERLCSFSDGQSQSKNQALDGYDYASPLREGLEKLILRNVDPIDFSLAFASEPATSLRFRLMAKRELLATVTAQADSQPDPDHVPVGVKRAMRWDQERADQAKLRKPWWKFW